MNHVDNPFQSPAVLSFCPGILGIERGLARAGVHCRVMAYLEIEAFIIANLVAGMEAGLLGAAPIWTDAKTFDAFPFRGKIHGIIGGYPCPGESLAGLREGHLYKGFIWPSIRRAIKASGPLWCFFENVDDHLTGTYPIVLRSLRNMGYRVEAGIYTAEEAGAPHERKRLFILAVADSYCNGHRTGTSGIIKKSSTDEGAEQWKERNKILRKWMRNVPGNGGQAVGNSCGQGLQKSSCGQQPNIHRATESLKGSEFIGTDTAKWPAGQGQEQFEWEAARVIESGLGCAIDGYNFREDLLRALGNSVVEQTAELAFIDLLNKHINQWQKV